MTTAINKGHVSLYVIDDLNDKGIGSCPTTLKTYSYAERATNFGTKTWGNLIARIFDVISHMFCKKVDVRGSNAANGAWENHTYWVKGEVTNKTGSLASSRFSSFSSQENPFSRPASGSGGSIETIASNPKELSSPVRSRSASPVGLDLEVEESSIILFPAKLVAEAKMKKAQAATDQVIENYALEGDTKHAAWLRIPQDIRISLNDEFGKAKIAFDQINARYQQLLAIEAQ